MNKTTLKSRATLIGKMFESKGVKLSRAEQLNLVAQLEGARDWHHANGEMAVTTAEETATDARELRPLDSLQWEAAQAYCSGDYSHMQHEAELTDADTLFSFLIREIGDAQGSRDEAVNMVRTAVLQLEDVVFALENETFAAESAKRDPSNWDVTFLTNRFGELENDLDEALRQKYEGTLALQRVIGAVTQESTFVVECNGHLGLLFEVELPTAESDGPGTQSELQADGPVQFKSAAQLRKELERDIVTLRKEYPFMQWKVAGSDEVYEGRIGVWGFSPEACIVSPELAREVEATLFKLYHKP